MLKSEQILVTFWSKLLILKWRRRESNPRPKTFRAKVYILVRFRFVSCPGLKEPAS